MHCFFPGFWGGACPAWGAAGDLLWEHTFNFNFPIGGFHYPWIMDYGIAVSSTTCIVYGISYNYEATPNSIGFIKAFDTTTGNLKWERTLTIGPRNNYILSIIIDGNIAYIKTGIDNILGPNYNEDFLGAYNINTGQSIWEKKTSTNISHSRDPLQYMALVNNRLIQVTAKWQENVFPPTYHNILVQAYQAKEIVVMPSNSLLLQQ